MGDGHGQHVTCSLVMSKGCEQNKTVRGNTCDSHWIGGGDHARPTVGLDQYPAVAQ